MISAPRFSRRPCLGFCRQPVKGALVYHHDVFGQPSIYLGIMGYKIPRLCKKYF